MHLQLNLHTKALTNIQLKLTALVRIETDIFTNDQSKIHCITLQE